MFAVGAPPDRPRGRRVQDPRDHGKVAFTVPLRDRALSVSGQLGAVLRGERRALLAHHGSRTGRPAQGVLSVVVLAPSGTAGDVIGTTLFVLGAARGAALLGTHRRYPRRLFLLPGAGTVVDGSSDLRRAVHLRPKVHDGVAGHPRQRELGRACRRDVVDQGDTAESGDVGLARCALPQQPDTQPLDLAPAVVQQVQARACARRRSAGRSRPRCRRCGACAASR